MVASSVLMKAAWKAAWKAAGKGVMLVAPTDGPKVGLLVERKGSLSVEWKDDW